MKKFNAFRCFTACLILFATLAHVAAKDSMQTNPTIVAGWVELIYIGDAKTPIRAKLDTGAKTSSLNAPGYKQFKRGSKKWVRFEIATRKGELIQIEQPLTRIARIRRARIGIVERPVIKLYVCLAGLRRETEFTLTNRSNMNYPILIGRRFLSSQILVNSKATFLTSNSCLK